MRWIFDLFCKRPPVKMYIFGSTAYSQDSLVVCARSEAEARAAITSGLVMDWDDNPGIAVDLGGRGYKLHVLEPRQVVEFENI